MRMRRGYLRRALFSRKRFGSIGSVGRRSERGAKVSELRFVLIKSKEGVPRCGDLSAETNAKYWQPIRAVWVRS